MATCVGATLSFVLLHGLNSRLESTGLGGALTIGFTLILNGFSISAAQTFVLQRYVTEVYIWVLLTTLSSFVGGGVWVILAIMTFFSRWNVVQSYNVEQAENLIPSIVCGTVIGSFQYLFLKAISSRAGWWILTSILGFTVASITLEALPSSLSSLELVIALLCMINGVIQASSLVWLLGSVSSQHDA